MDAQQMRDERALVADARALSSAIQHDMLVGAAPSHWQMRRREIAALRERVRVMRNAHLGRGADSIGSHDRRP